MEIIIIKNTKKKVRINWWREPEEEEEENPGNFFLCGGLSHDEVTLIAQETRKRKKECRPAVGFLSVRCMVVGAFGNKVVDWTLSLRC